MGFAALALRRAFTSFTFRASSSAMSSPTRWKADEEHDESKNFLTATRVPPPSPEEAAMLRTPARHADVLTVDFVCGDVELKEVVLARKQLDSVRAPPPPRRVRCRDWRR